MTNYQCYCYSAKALANILKSKEELNSDTFYSELYYLWDIYDEETIEKIVRKESFNNELF